MAVPGMMQMLKAFGIDIDPEEIKQQALQFKALLGSIDARLAALQAQNEFIISHLTGETDHGGRQIEKPVGQDRAEQAAD